MSPWKHRGLRNSNNRVVARWFGLLSFGVFSVCLGQAPANDNFTDALVLNGNTIIFSGSLTNATLESGESSSGCNINNLVGGSIFWSWIATNSTAVVIDVLQNTGNAASGLGVHTGSSAASLVDIDCTSLDGLTNRYVRFAATSGTTYYIRAWGPPNSFTFRLRAANAPVIISSPQSQTVPETSSLMLGVIAGGFSPLTYQWQFAGNPLPGQTVPSLVVHYLAASQAGDYSVVVSNSSGVTTSAVAMLTISPTRPPLLLAPVNSPETNRFSFSLAGENGRSYRIWSTSNLVDWADEQSLTPDVGYPALVVNTNATSVYSISIDSNQKFLRASHFMNTEICIAQLKAINHAFRCWAVETRYSKYSPVAYTDLQPYLMNPVVCPSGGTTFADSYTISDVMTPPTCKKVPSVHKLTP